MLGNGRLFFAKIDLKRCYDSILHEKLLNIMQKVLKDTSNADESVYNLQKYCSINPAKRSFLKIVTLKAHDFHFNSFVNEEVKSENKRDTIFVNQASNTAIKRSTLLRQIEHLIKANIVKIDNQKQVATLHRV